MLHEDRKDFPPITTGLGPEKPGSPSQAWPEFEGYKIVEELPGGGQAAVYKAIHIATKTKVALKVLPPGMLASAKARHRFEQEVDLAASLHHPHIVSIRDSGIAQGQYYFAMEYISGQPPDRYVAANSLSLRESMLLFCKTCAAVAHAHQRGVIHRDLKLSNILVDARGDPHVLDFGLAKGAGTTSFGPDGISAPSMTGEIKGTLAYMSPEQAGGRPELMDVRTDVYSLGVIFYLTGDFPYDVSGTTLETIRQIESTEPKRPKEISRKFNPEIEAILLKCLAKEPRRRYHSAADLGEDIQRWLDGLPIFAKSVSSVYLLRKFARRHRTQALVGGLLLAVVLPSAAILGRYQQARHNLHVMKETLAKQNARSSLSAAQADYASGRYAEASKALQVLVDNKYVGSQARLLRARVALDQPEANLSLAELQTLLAEPNEIIVSQAHLLLAQIYLESRADDDATARELEHRANEHLQKAQSLASDSAQACFNRALLSDTPAERMELLNKALTINPGHVDSRRIRALAYHASRNYDDMEIDASVVTVVAKDRPEGYALRAIALREKAQLRGQKELLSRAVAEHSRAIELAPTQSRFHDERRETYMRMGEYEKALADARESIRLSPEEGIYHFHAFCALTALGRYAEAQRESKAILIPSNSSPGESQFWKWAAIYAREVVDRHALWHPAGQEPQGPAFAILRQTVEAHQSLAQKARCVVREGLVATWSPNGEELAYGRGPLGYSAIEVLNLKTGTTRLLSYSGFDPAWSPDGRRIAFVRHRRIMRLQDLAEGKKTYVPGQEDREIWIMNADGTGKPRPLARGGYPSWSRDSQRLYYYLHEEGGYLCSISLEGDNPRSTRVIPSLGPFPVVSPDEKYVVWHVNDVAELVDLSNGKVVARWIGFFPNWSPDSKSLVFSRFDGRHDGVWVCDVEKGKAARVLEDCMCFRCSWAPNTGQMALSPALTIRQTWGYIYPGMWGSIWMGPLDSGIFEAGSSALVQDWPRDESDPRSLMHMVQGYETIPQRTAEAEQLRDRLMELLRQAAASDDTNSLQPVEQLADAYLWFGQYDKAEQLYRQALDRQLATSGATAQAVLDLTEELVRFYLDVVNRYDQAEPLCLELLKTRRDVLGVDSSRTIRTLVLLARIYERQKRYPQAQRLYLDILNLPRREDPEEGTPEVYESVVWPFLFAPLSYFLDETAFTLGALDDQSAGTAPDKRWTICAHYLLARLYATCPMPELHDVTKAVEHGTSACEWSGWTEPICLDALAAAWAEAGRFDLAIRRQREAVERLSGIKAALMTTAFVDRLARYERGVAQRPGGLVARWEFEPSQDGMVLDTSGNNLHGRRVGDAQVYADPERGHVLRLDGEGDWVDCGAAITLSVWIKVGRFDKVWQTIVAKGVSAWGLQRDQTTDVLQFACTGVGATRAREGSRPEILRDHPNVNDGRWHHVAGIYDGQRLRLYVDGELDALAPVLTSPRIHTSKDHVLIGTNAGIQPSCEWNGLIDDLRIYNYALPPEDIKALHEGKEPMSDKGSTR